MADHRAILVAGHHDDGDARPLRPEEQQPGETAHPRHREIEQDEIHIRHLFQRDGEAFEIDGLVEEGAGNGAAHGLA